jgi:CubicO group peptidase (beta-lactamase class C family)
MKSERYSKLGFVSLVCIFLMTSFVFAQNLPSDRPEALGISSARLKNLDSAMQRYVDEGKLAGLLTMIARRGKVVHFETYGYMDKETATPMKKDTIFRIWSLTKPVTSVAMMMLFEEGRFQLDDPVSRYIPEFKDMTVYAGGSPENLKTEKLNSELTIRHLLTLTSGLIYGEPGMGDETIVSVYKKADLENPHRTLKEMIAVLCRLPFAYQPGSRFSSGVQHDVLAYLVQIISGMPFDQFLAQRIFNPLKMKDTGFYVPSDKLSRFASEYGLNEKREIKKIDDPQSSVYANPVRWLSGGGGLLSTAQDYMRFAQMILNGGQLEGARILSPKTLQLMMTNHIPGTLAPFPDKYPMPDWNLRGYGFGLGFAVMMDLAKADILGSEGMCYFAGGNNVFVFVDPREELVSMVWTQFEPFCYYPLNRQFQVLAYQSVMESYKR